MFEKALASKLEKIFKLKRVDFALPSESQEQDVIFVQIDDPHVRVKDQKQVARVEGRFQVFAAHGKMPHGYFARSIAEADPAVTKDFFFSDIDESAGTYRDLDVRSARFVFFYSSQYDPEQGTINQVEIQVEVSE